MTEQEWQDCTDPQAMLVALDGQADDRKLRLFAIACCRRIWPLLPDESFREAVRAAERHLDGEATEAEVRAWLRAADEVRLAQYTALGTATYLRYGPHAACEAARCCLVHPRLARDVAAAALRANPHTWEQDADRRAQVGLLHEIFGPLPFRPVEVGRSALRWRDGTIPRLARSIHEDRAFDRLPVLADALEEAGGDDADLLGHLRGPGPHVRGSWAVDLLLG